MPPRFNRMIMRIRVHNPLHPFHPVHPSLSITHFTLPLPVLAHRHGFTRMKGMLGINRIKSDPS